MSLWDVSETLFIQTLDNKGKTGGEGLTGFGLRPVEPERCTILPVSQKVNITYLYSCRTLSRPSYLLYKSMSIPRVVEIYEPEEMCHGWKHAFSDVVSAMVE